jgi:hypothetical protein
VAESQPGNEPGRPDQAMLVVGALIVVALIFCMIMFLVASR